MVVWIHFTFQTASLVSLFVIRPRREALEALRRVGAFASSRHPQEEGSRQSEFLRVPRADVQNFVNGGSNV
jgi:hypothetical protein